jgi:uncharacterized protein DUF4153
MATDVVTVPSVPAATTAWRPTIRSAGRVVAVAALLGIVGQLLFFDVGLGVNLPVAIGLLLVAGWLVRRRTPSLLSLEAWLAPGALLFAAFAALRADPVIESLDLLTSLALAVGWLAALGGLQVVTRPFWSLVALGLRAMGWAAVGAIPALAGARDGLPSIGGFRRRLGTALPVVRGLAIAVPIVLVFIALFSAADAVFARVIGDMFNLDLGLGDLPGRLILAVALGWVAAGALAFAAAERDVDEVPNGRSDGWKVGTTEAITVLSAVAAVFLLFVVLQGAYLFGGRDTMRASGIGYAEYARRGFFELVAVAFLAGGLVIAAERVARHRTRLLVAMAMALVVLTGVVIASSALRLRLYQEAYGWTELRFYVLATIVLLAVGAITLLAALATDRVRWVGHVMIGSALAIGLVLNLIGPVRFISEQNVARVLVPGLVPAGGRSGLDELYAISLGDDAIPSLVRALPVLEEGDASYLAGALGRRLDELRGEDGLDAWQAWNAGRAAARDALQAADNRGELP